VAKSDKRAEAIRGARSPAFLLAQVGAHAATQFGKKLDEVKLTRPHAGVLRVIAARPGLSQQDLASVLSVVPSRLVILVDELEERGLVERRDHPEDRRVYALYLTQRGGQAMADIGRIARAHNDATCAALSAEERAQLAGLLERIAVEQGLESGVHPGFQQLDTDDGPRSVKTRSPKR
jgi:DNA-binding MarR family transcriptional regulator